MNPEQEVQRKAEERPGEEIISPIEDDQIPSSIGIPNDIYDDSNKFFPFFSKRPQGYGEIYKHLISKKVPGFQNTSKLLIKLHFRKLKLLEAIR